MTTYINIAPQAVLEQAFGPHTEADVFPDPRLQQFREEFEAQRQAAHDYLMVRFPGSDPRLHLILREPEHFAKWEADKDGCYHPVREAAQRYIIARDFGEFDRKRAVMLWKLQNGGAV